MRFVLIQIAIFYCAYGGELSCIITDKKNGTPLPGTLVCLTEIEQCATADTAGRALFSGISPGRYTLRASREGFEAVSIEHAGAAADAPETLRVQMTRSSAVLELDKDVVRADRIDLRKIQQIASITHLDTLELLRTAGTANDIYRVLLSVPSAIGAASDMKNELYVRGGGSLENIFIVDGIEINNASHFSYAASSGGEGIGFIDGTIVEAVDFYAGGMPASLPPVQSAVIDMRLHEGNRLRHHLKLHGSIAGLGLLAEGPFWGGRGSYLANFRYIDISGIRKFLPINIPFQFGDAQSKLHLQLNRNNDISLTTFGALDRSIPAGEAYEQQKYKVSYIASGLQWNSSYTNINNRLLLSFVERSNSWEGDMHERKFIFPNNPLDSSPYISYSENVVNSNLSGNAVYEQYRHQNLHEDRPSIQLKNDLIVPIFKADVLAIGFSISRNAFTKKYSEFSEPQKNLSGTMPDSSTAFFPDTAASLESQFTTYDTTAGGYFNYTLRKDSIKIVSGVRADYFRMQRACGISPRCAVSCGFPHIGTIALSAGLYYQRIADIFSLGGESTESFGPASPLPINPSAIGLQRSWQGVVSWQRQLMEQHTLSIEAYYKWYDREYTKWNPIIFQLEMDYQNARQSGASWNPSPPRGNKKAYGMDFSLQNPNWHGCYYGIGYSLFSVKEKYANGSWYDDPENVRSNLAVTLGAEFLKHHGFSLRALIHGGRPYSKDKTDEVYGNSLDKSNEYYSERLPMVISIAARYNFSFSPRLGTVTGYVDIWNLLNRTQATRRSYTWNKDGETKENGIIPLLGVIVDLKRPAPSPK
jgi:hypothetical protein